MHDELRRLDEDLAAGRVDADSYRRRRDELLAARPTEPPPSARPASASVLESAPPRSVPSTGDGRDEAGSVRPAVAGPAGSVSGEVGAEGAAGGVPGAHHVDPDEVAVRGAGAGGLALDEAAVGLVPERAKPTNDGAADVRDPFPPPFRWDGAPDADGSPDADALGHPDAVAHPDAGPAGLVPDSTQVVAPWWPADVEPERTQVVRGGGAQAGAADATQVVGRSRPRVPDPRLGLLRAGPPAPPPERTQFVPGAALTRAGDLRSVPARRTVPPWVDERSVAAADARRPGREVFARRRGPSPAAVIGTAALVLVVLVVLALSFLLG